MKTFPSLALMAFASFSLLERAEAATILSTNFDSTPVGNITTSGAITNSDGMTATVAADRFLTVVDSAGDHSLQFVDNGTTTGAPIASKIFAGASTDGTGSNLINGTFNLTVFNIASANDIRIMINSGSNLNGSSTTSLVSMLINRSGDFSYLNGGTNTNPAFNLTPSTEYVFSINLDASSTVQDLWRLRIATAAAPATNLFDTGWINTRAANVLPNVLVWNGGANTTTFSASPFAQVDDLNFELVPEPSTAALFVAGFVIMGMARKNRSRI